MRILAQRRAAAALVLTVCLLAAQALAAPGTPAGDRARVLGEITSFGRVLVSGEEAASGATVFAGSSFATAEEAGAVVNLGDSGRVRLDAETAGRLNFGERGLEGALEGGAMTVSKPEGVAAVFSTRDGQVSADKGSAAVFTLSLADGVTRVRTEAGKVEFRAGDKTKTVGAGETAQAGQGGQGGGNSGGQGRGLGRNAAYGIIGFTGVVLAAVIWAVTHDDNPQTAPPVIVISPSR